MSKNERSLGKNWQSRARTGQGEAAKNAPDVETRQRVRRLLRAVSFIDVNRKFGPEPRENRRRMALRMARRAFTAAKRAQELEPVA